MDLATYLENSADGLMRGVKWFNEYANPLTMLDERDAASVLPGAGIVEAGEAYQRGAEAWQEGEYLEAAGEYAYGAMNQGMEFIPGMAAAGGAARIGARKLPRLIEVFHGAPDVHGGRIGPGDMVKDHGDVGIHVATDPDHANMYATGLRAGSTQPNVQPYLLDARRSITLDDDPVGFGMKEDFIPQIHNNRFTRGLIDDLEAIPDEQWITPYVFGAMRNHGFDSVKYWDALRPFMPTKPAYAVGDASQLLPRFDPNTFVAAQQRGVTLNYRPTSRGRTFLPEDFR